MLINGNSNCNNQTSFGAAVKIKVPTEFQEKAVDRIGFAIKNGFITKEAEEFIIPGKDGFFQLANDMFLLVDKGEREELNVCKNIVAGRENNIRHVVNEPEAIQKARDSITEAHKSWREKITEIANRPDTNEVVYSETPTKINDVEALNQVADKASQKRKRFLFF